ncbi:MAG: diguanylate cyclase [Thiotrichaceae bacterium]|nr:diguanylate cyclase [Thiotrichaceae bacterium]
MNAVEEKFQNIHESIYRHIADSIKIYEVSIESFAGVLTTEQGNDYKNARRFAKQLRRHYPDIYMFEIAKRISHGERDELERNMQNSGYSNFMVHTFGYDSDRKSHLSPAKDIYYPVVFIEPELRESMGVLGLDLSDSSSILKDALERSFDKQTHVASRPFKLIENNQGYILYRELRAVEVESRHELIPRQNLYALLVVDASKLIPDWAYNKKGLSFSLQYPEVGMLQDGNQKDYSGNAENSNSWPLSLLSKLSKTSELKSQSQPFKLATEYTVQWSDFDFAAIINYIIMATAAFTIAFFISMVWYRKKVQNTKQQETNYRLANYDVLTDLPNKIHAKEIFYQAVSLLNRNKKKLALLYIDLNKFKQVNDKYGHKVGDILLQHASKRLNSVLRDSDTLARLHGDEFVIFLNDIENLSNAEAVVDNIKAAFEHPFNLTGIPITIGISIGVSIFPDDAVSFGELLDASDRNMYEDKKQDRHSVVQNFSR